MPERGDDRTPLGEVGALGRTTSDYDFELPEDRIAQAPALRREESRLLCVDRVRGTLDDRNFADLTSLIPPGDLLVLNETRVFPARLLGRRAGGGRAEVLLLHPAAEAPGCWVALVRPGAKLKTGRHIEIGPELSVEIVESRPGGERIVRLHTELELQAALQRYGELPLPPYVRRRATREDLERYQTVFARTTGSVAAPTAGLHFTTALLEKLEQSGVAIARITLHVGPGTFRPVEVEDPALHPMHSEWYEISPEAAERINTIRTGGGALWAVGTTTVRTLESAAEPDGTIRPGQGWTDIFIRPPYPFRAVDRLITNFHLPRSTLLMLVAAFAGYDLMRQAYAHALAGEYRFFSYGDAMLIR